MRRTRFASIASTFCFGFIALISNSLASAQVSAVPARIAGPVDDAVRVTLKGGISGLARSEFDKGSVAGSTEMANVRIVFSRSAEQQSALDKLMAEQLDPNSANYRKWLTPEQFGRMFGPADSDIAAVAAWLESHGLRVAAVPPGRVSITFSGTVAQLEEAFHTSIHSFNDGERQFLANVSSPQIPTALAPVIAGVARLDTIQPRPHAVRGNLGNYDVASKNLTAAAVGPRAELTGSSGNSLYVVPGDAATIYNTPNQTLNANFSGSTSYTGQGVTIGIGGDATINASTVVNYRTKFLGDSTAPTISYCTNSTQANPTITCSTTNPGNITTTDTDEAYIDTQLAGGLAPGAAIHYYASNDLFSAVEQAINDNKVDIFSLSFGACESSLGTSNNSYMSALWQQAAAQGIVVTVSTGDNGSAGCDNNNKVTAASLGLAVNGLASTPYNLAIGGTDYYPLASSSTFGTYVNSTNSSATLYRTAKSYIPEDTWNQSTSTNLALAQNVPARDSSNATNIVAASGGMSACATMSGTSCSAGYSKPSWQRGTGVPADSVRDIPDVSIFGSSGVHGAAWLVCTDDTGKVNNATVTSNCTAQADGNFYFMGYGGTSTSAPAFAGMLALVQQKVGGRLGLTAAKTLYDLYNGSNASAIFHDTTHGNISVFCTSGTPNCSANTAGNLFLTGYNTGAGYDLATGMGSVDVTQLVSNWSSATGSAASTITATASPTSTTSNQSVTVTVTVSGTGGTPTGTVTLTGGGYTSSPESLSAGNATITVPANKLSVGSDTLTITYSGDPTYASTTTTVSVTIKAPYSMTPSAPSAVTRGTAATSTITFAADASYTGSVALTCALTSSTTGINDVPTCTVTPSITITAGTASGAATLTVNSTAAQAALQPHGLPAWTGAGGGAVLAFLVFLGIPARRKSWRNLVGLVVLLAALGTLSACGSGGGTSNSGGGTPTKDPGTTAGTYTFTVTATGNPAVTPAPTTTVKVTIN